MKRNKQKAEQSFYNILSRNIFYLFSSVNIYALTGGVIGFLFGITISIYMVANLNTITPQGFTDLLNNQNSYVKYWGRGSSVLVIPMLTAGIGILFGKVIEFVHKRLRAM